MCLYHVGVVFDVRRPIRQKGGWVSSLLGCVRCPSNGRTGPFFYNMDDNTHQGGPTPPCACSRRRGPRRRRCWRERERARRGGRWWLGSLSGPWRGEGGLLRGHWRCLSMYVFIRIDRNPPTLARSIHPSTHPNNSARACLGMGPPPGAAAAAAVPPPDDAQAAAVPPLLLLSLRACIAKEDWAGVASLLLPEGQGHGE